MDMSQVLYKGQVGSRLYNCQGEYSDDDWVIIMSPQSLQPYEQMNRGKLDYFIFNTNDIYNYLFCNDESNFALRQNCHEQLFSNPDSDINTPFSEWLINNRQLILDSNRPKFKQSLLCRSNNLLPQKIKYAYIFSPKNLVKAIINLQTYINYAENPDDGYFKAQHLTSEQLEMINLARQGLLPPIELYNYLQSLKIKAENYSSFWDTPPNTELIQTLSNEMQIAINKSINIS